MASRFLRWLPALLSIAAIAIPAFPQDPAAKPADPIPSPAEQEKLEAQLLKKLKNPYKKWLTEDVAYIIFPQERLGFLQLQTDAERESYIRQFWQRRDPTPDTLENEWRDEHYRRMEYANLHFTAGTKGWRTDRGFFYVVYGPPDEVQRNEGAWLAPEGDDAKLANAVHGGRMGAPVPTYPFQKWRYRYIEGIGFNVTLEFVDKTSTGRYDLANDIGEKFEIVPVPGGLFDAYTLGLIESNLSRRDMLDMRARRIVQVMHKGELAKFAADPEDNKKLPSETVTSRLVRNLLPVQTRIDFFRGGNRRTATLLVLGFKKRDLGFAAQGDRNQVQVSLRGSVSDVVGRPVATFERAIDWNVSEGWLNVPGPALFEKQLELPPGRYQLVLEVEDSMTSKQARIDQPLEVPDFNAGLAASSLVLTRPSGGRQPGGLAATTEPSMDGRYARSEKVGVYLQVYGVRADAATGKARASVEYLILRGEQVVFRQQETLGEVPEGKALTLTKSLALAGVQPGEYIFRVRITDEVRGQTVEPQAKFTVVP